MSYDADCYCDDPEWEEREPGEICAFCDMEFAFLMRTLGKNLATAGALCKSFGLGGDHEAEMSGYFEGYFDEEGLTAWFPGCGRPMP